MWFLIAVLFLGFLYAVQNNWQEGSAARQQAVDEKLSEFNRKNAELRHERELKLSKMTPEERRHFEILEKLDELKASDALNLARQAAQRIQDNGNPNKPGSAAWNNARAARRRNHH